MTVTKITNQTESQHGNGQSPHTPNYTDWTNWMNTNHQLCQRKLHCQSRQYGRRPNQKQPRKPPVGQTDTMLSADKKNRRNSGLKSWQNNCGQRIQLGDKISHRSLIPERVHHCILGTLVATGALILTQNHQSPVNAQDANYVIHLKSQQSTADTPPPPLPPLCSQRRSQQSEVEPSHYTVEEGRGGECEKERSGMMWNHGAVQAT
ncbi:hypothetical protein PAMP_020797 [Pampus punctatissimus]